MERRQSKAARRQRVKALREAGQTISQIGRALGLDRKTVRNYLNAPEPVQPQALSSQVAPSDPDRPRSPLLAPFVGYLQDRWQDGCHNASQLYRELVERGYVGSRSTLAQAVQGWREPGMSKRQQRLRRRTSLRWLVLRPPEQLKTEEKALLEEVLAGNPEIALGHELVQRFREVIAKRDVGALDEWLAASRRSGLPSFVGLANGIEGDRSAVEVALSLPWSSGPVEGQITRVKLIKRQGYGRAKLDLLRCRVLAA